MTLSENKNLKTALAVWAQKHGIRPVDFARATGYTPSYGWSLLRGQAEMTPEALGRIILAYGTEAAGELVNLAGLTASVTALPHPDGAQVVPDVSISATVGQAR
jgi:hypothetical protein